jgi:hypothetical protein
MSAQQSEPILRVIRHEESFEVRCSVFFYFDDNKGRAAMFLCYVGCTEWRRNEAALDLEMRLQEIEEKLHTVAQDFERHVIRKPQIMAERAAAEERKKRSPGASPGRDPGPWESGQPGVRS